MWEVIRKIRGIPLDQNDEALNDMVRRTLKDEIIPFDEWQDLVDDLEEEIGDGSDVEVLLQKYGLTPSELVTRAETARKEFLDTLSRYGLPLNDHLKLCQSLYEKASADPSDELLRLYCDIVCDGGFLLDTERTDDDGAISWLLGKEDADALYCYLSERAQKNLQFHDVIKRAKRITLSGQTFTTEAPSKADEVFQVYVQIFRPVRSQEKLLGNIVQLLQAADHTAALTPIKPLFLYRMLTRHAKRMQTNEALNVDLSALWNYQEYTIEQDNGKNFQMNTRYLKLFCRLCDIFHSDRSVDIPLCACGFEQLSNLSEFYRLYELEGFVIPFEPPMEDVLEESLFTCFEHDYEDNMVMVSGGITPKVLDRFQCGTDRDRGRALARISDYMNGHAADLVTRFWGTSADEVKALCAEILESSALPVSQLPRTAQDTALFLAAINGGLMDVVDGFAIQYLVAAGKMLIHE